MSRKKTFDEFLVEAKKKYSDKFYFDESTYVNTNTKMRIICPKHGEFWKTPKSILKNDCIKCSYEKRGEKYRSNTKEFIEKAQKVHGNKYDYSKVNYTTAHEKVIIICPDHGEFLQMPNYHLCGEGCPFCNSSHLEEITELFLINNNINFVKQYKPMFLGKQSLDFYIPDKNIAIECQGKQHFGFGGWSKNFDQENLLNLDIRKNNLCKENGIEIKYVIPNNFKIPIELNLYNDSNTFFVNNLNDLLNFL